MERILIGMSGGVDSAAAALLLAREGRAAAGATLRLFPGAPSGDAQAVALALGLEYHIFDFADAFGAQVIRRFADTYARGETPNPCVDCNRHIKFPLLLERARSLSYDGIATGHYARIERDPQSGRWLLKRARDAGKDQTYVLYTLTQELLEHTHFPLGGLLKSEARAMAKEAGLPVADKADSQDICFVPDGDYAAFLTRVCGLSPIPGPVVDTQGSALGRHAGLLDFTIGQRSRLPVSLGEKTYVVAKDAATATLTVGRERDLYTGALTARDLNWIAIERLDTPLKVTVKTRYRANEAPATVEPLDGGRVRVVFETPQRAVTPGQSAVFYQGDTVVGGGVIEGIGGNG